MNEESVILIFEKHCKNLTLIEFDKKKDIFKKYYSLATENETKKRWRELILTFKTSQYKKESIWMFLNNDITKEEFEETLPKRR